MLKYHVIISAIIVLLGINGAFAEQKCQPLPRPPKKPWKNTAITSRFFLPNSAYGWAIEEHFTSYGGSAVDSDSVLLRTTDGGCVWEEFPNAKAWGNLFFINKNEGWTVTRSAISKTKDSGRTWVVVAQGLQHPPYDMRYAEALYFIDSLRGWILDRKKLEDNMRVWNVIPNDPHGRVKRERHGVRLWRTSDGGETWTPMTRDEALANFGLGEELYKTKFNWDLGKELVDRLKKDPRLLLITD